MLKKISIDKLKPGMFVEKFDQNWLDAPVISPRIGDMSEVELLRGHGIQAVFINTDKGLDVEDEAAGKGRKPARTFLEEIKGADEVYHSARQSIASTLEVVRLGEAPDLGPVEDAVNGIIESIFRNRDAMLSLVALKGKSQEIFDHCLRVCVLSLAFAESLDFPLEELRNIGMGAILHDVGKMTLPEKLMKKNGPMSNDEYETYRTHALEGARLMDGLAKVNKRALMVLLHHHERPDGTGFPQGLDGDAIAETAKMVAIADTFDNLLNKPQVKGEMTPHEALDWLRKWKGKMLDAKLVDEFAQAVGIYPAGSLVRLSNHRLAVVVASGGPHVLPSVWVVFDENQRLLSQGYWLDLSNQLGSVPVSILAAVNPQQIGFDLADYVTKNGIFSGAPRIGQVPA